MNTTEQQIVTSVNGTFQALVMQDFLEKAGIPATISASRNTGLLDVSVPVEYLLHAQNLLAPQRRQGEILIDSSSFSK